jgi:hypothetical protein
MEVISSITKTRGSMTERPNRVLRVVPLHEPDQDYPLKGKTPAECIEMMRTLARSAWAFMGKPAVDPDFRDILSEFSAEGVEFLLVGAYAMAAYGVPRATGDLDLWIRPSADNASRVLRALGRFGAPVAELTVEDLSTARFNFQIGVAPKRIDILTSIDGVEFRDAWAHRIVTQVEGLKIAVIGRDQLIQNKRATGHPKDLLDVALLEQSSGSPE